MKRLPRDRRALDLAMTTTDHLLASDWQARAAFDAGRAAP